MCEECYSEDSRATPLRGAGPAWRGTPSTSAAVAAAASASRGRSGAGCSAGTSPFRPSSRPNSTCGPPTTPAKGPAASTRSRGRAAGPSTKFSPAGRSWRPFCAKTPASAAPRARPSFRPAGTANSPAPRCGGCAPRRWRRTSPSGEWMELPIQMLGNSSLYTPRWKRPPLKQQNVRLQARGNHTLFWCQYLRNGMIFSSLLALCSVLPSPLLREHAARQDRKQVGAGNILGVPYGWVRRFPGIFFD